MPNRRTLLGSALKVVRTRLLCHLSSNRLISYKSTSSHVVNTDSKMGKKPAAKRNEGSGKKGVDKKVNEGRVKLVLQPLGDVSSLRIRSSQRADPLIVVSFV